MSVSGGHATPRVAFIHSDLDDAGLTAAQFRVFAHVCRRGECTASAETMATTCRLNGDTVWEALRVLEDRRMIARTPRPGKTSVVTVTSPATWLPEPTGNGGVPEKRGRPSDSATGTGKEGAAPTGNGGVQSISLKLIPEGVAANGGKAGKDLLETLAPAKASRRRDERWEKLAALDGWTPNDPLTGTAGGRVGKALKDILTASPDVTADDINRRIAAYRRMFPRTPMTSTAIAANWARLKPTPAPQPLPEGFIS